MYIYICIKFDVHVKEIWRFEVSPALHRALFCILSSHNTRFEPLAWARSGAGEKPRSESQLGSSSGLRLAAEERLHLKTLKKSFIKEAERCLEMNGVYIDLNGIKWISMDFNGFQWISH